MSFDELPELSASPQLSMLLRHGLTELTRAEARAELRRLLDLAFQSGITSERESKKLMAGALKPKKTTKRLRGGKTVGKLLRPQMTELTEGRVPRLLPPKGGR